MRRLLALLGAVIVASGFILIATAPAAASDDHSWTPAELRAAGVLDVAKNGDTWTWTLDGTPTEFKQLEPTNRVLCGVNYAGSLPACTPSTTFTEPAECTFVQFDGLPGYGSKDPYVCFPSQSESPSPSPSTTAPQPTASPSPTPGSSPSPSPSATPEPSPSSTTTPTPPSTPTPSAPSSPTPSATSPAEPPATPTASPTPSETPSTTAPSPTTTGSTSAASSSPSSTTPTAPPALASTGASSVDRTYPVLGGMVAIFGGGALLWVAMSRRKRQS